MAEVTITLPRRCLMATAAEHDRTLVTVRVVDVATQARRLFGDALGDLPEHDYRFTCNTARGGEVCFSRYATAARVVEYLRQHGDLPAAEPEASPTDSAYPLGSVRIRERKAHGHWVGEPLAVIGEVDASATGPTVLCVGRLVDGGGWTQTEYIVLSPAERDQLVRDLTGSPAASGGEPT